MTEYQVNVHDRFQRFKENYEAACQKLPPGGRIPVEEAMSLYTQLYNIVAHNSQYAQTDAVIYYLDVQRRYPAVKHKHIFRYVEKHVHYALPKDSDTPLSLCTVHTWRKSKTLNCNHSFCCDCLWTLVDTQDKPSCPICRKEFKSSELVEKPIW